MWSHLPRTTASAQPTIEQTEHATPRRTATTSMRVVGAASKGLAKHTASAHAQPTEPALGGHASTKIMRGICASQRPRVERKPARPIPPITPLRGKLHVGPAGQPPPCAMRSWGWGRWGVPRPGVRTPASGTTLACGRPWRRSLVCGLPPWMAPSEAPKALQVSAHARAGRRAVGGHVSHAHRESCVLLSMTACLD